MIDFTGVIFATIYMITKSYLGCCGVVVMVDYGFLAHEMLNITFAVSACAVFRRQPPFPRPTMTIEAMAEGRIKYHLERNQFDEREMRLIYTWATAQAMREKAEWHAWNFSEKDQPYNGEYPNYWEHEHWTDADWLAAVLQRIGWPQDNNEN